MTWRVTWPQHHLQQLVLHLKCMRTAPSVGRGVVVFPMGTTPDKSALPVVSFVVPMDGLIGRISSSESRLPGQVQHCGHLCLPGQKNGRGGLSDQVLSIHPHLRHLHHHHHHHHHQHHLYQVGLPAVVSWLQLLLPDWLRLRHHRLHLVHHTGNHVHRYHHLRISLSSSFLPPQTTYVHHCHMYCHHRYPHLRISPIVTSIAFRTIDYISFTTPVMIIRVRDACTRENGWI